MNRNYTISIVLLALLQVLAIPELVDEAEKHLVESKAWLSSAHSTLRPAFALSEKQCSFDERTVYWFHTLDMNGDQFLEINEVISR